MKKLFILMMLMTASFTFASNGLENNKIEITIPVKSITVSEIKTEKSDLTEDDKAFCYCSGGTCGCGPTMADAKAAYDLACSLP